MLKIARIAALQTQAKIADFEHSDSKRVDLVEFALWKVAGVVICEALGKLGGFEPLGVAGSNKGKLKLEYSASSAVLDCLPTVAGFGLCDPEEFGKRLAGYLADLVPGDAPELVAFLRVLFLSQCEVLDDIW